MKRNLKVIEPMQATHGYQGPYQEVAIFVRELLRCDYALVAVPEKNAIRIQGLASRYETNGSLAANMISRLRDWGPVVVDDARLIAAPVSSNGTLLGVLIGYSSKAGTFTVDDLEKLMAYSRVACGILANAAIEAQNTARTTFSADELLHFSRLITMGELSACFAHEVTNPLMLIRGHIRFMEESIPADHPLRHNFEIIERASHRIEDMAKRMLDFGRKRTRRTEPCNIAELISDALRFVQPFFRTNFIDVQVDLAPQLPTIAADRWQLVQAVVNLLQNAGDAMAEVQRRVLSITAGFENEKVQIVISDTGTGIAPADTSRIFEPFFTTKGDRGTGLGLFITKQAIEEHRGTVNVRTGDHGTSFVISLPL